LFEGWSQSLLADPLCPSRESCSKTHRTHALSWGTQRQEFNCDCGFGGLGVSILASGTQDRGFAPDWSRRISPAGKIHSMPFFGGEVKQSVPCPSFGACKRTQLSLKIAKLLAKFH
jgi:hypothetical protein